MARTPTSRGAAPKSPSATPSSTQADTYRGNAGELQQQAGGKHPDAKALSGFGSAAVLEVVEDFRSDTFRAVYTVKFAGWVYVLHCFQKKSKSGIKTPKEDLDLIKARLKAAVQDFEAWQAKQGVKR